MQGAMYHPDFSSVVSYKSQQLSDVPDEQVSATIDAMRQLVLQDAPYMKSEALQAAQFGNGCAVRGVFDCVKRKIRFQLDEVTASVIPQSFNNPIVEVLIRPRDLSQLCMLQSNGVGDCDDFSMYAACLLTALNVPCAFATVAASPEDPTVYSHVYVVAYSDGYRIPVDCSHGPHVGWEAPNKYGKFREWPVSGFAVGSGGDSFVPWLLAAGVAVAGICYLGDKRI